MSAISTTRVFIIDDHAMFRAGLSLVIGAAMPNSLVFEAGAIEEALRSPHAEVDVVLLDIQLKGLNGLEGLSLIKKRWPQTPVLMLSSQDELPMQRLALERGAAGFISKAEPPQAIVHAIEQAALGNLTNRAPSPGTCPLPRLTARQCEVLDLMNLGLSNKQIAQKLALSDNTVRRHVQDILEFFNASSRTEAVFAARDKGLIG
jgi:DNA-binding NarL/FixJ family response regulator